MLAWICAMPCYLFRLKWQLRDTTANCTAVILYSLLTPSEWAVSRNGCVNYFKVNAMEWGIELWGSMFRVQVSCVNLQICTPSSTKPPYIRVGWLRDNNNGQQQQRTMLEDNLLQIQRRDLMQICIILSGRISFNFHLNISIFCHSEQFSNWVGNNVYEQIGRNSSQMKPSNIIILLLRRNIFGNRENSLQIKWIGNACIDSAECARSLTWSASEWVEQSPLFQKYSLALSSFEFCLNGQVNEKLSQVEKKKSYSHTNHINYPKPKEK